MADKVDPSPRTAKKDPSEMSCATCPIRRRAEEKPQSFLARLWRWHTTWCPGWKAYQAALAEQQ